MRAERLTLASGGRRRLDVAHAPQNNAGRQRAGEDYGEVSQEIVGRVQ